jgi:hypothetical protein
MKLICFEFTVVLSKSKIKQTVEVELKFVLEKRLAGRQQRRRSRRYFFVEQK